MRTILLLLLAVLSLTSTPSAPAADCPGGRCSIERSRTVVRPGVRREVRVLRRIGR